jgi:hypothetical protein
MPRMPYFSAERVPRRQPGVSELLFRRPDSYFLRNSGRRNSNGVQSSAKNRNPDAGTAIRLRQVGVEELFQLTLGLFFAELWTPGWSRAKLIHRLRFKHTLFESCFTRRDGMSEKPGINSFTRIFLRDASGKTRFKQGMFKTIRIPIFCGTLDARLESC